MGRGEERFARTASTRGKRLIREWATTVVRKGRVRIFGARLRRHSVFSTIMYPPPPSPFLVVPFRRSFKNVSALSENRKSRDARNFR